MNNPIKGVLYLEREHFELSLETRADMLQYIYPPEFVSNLDIINADGLKLNLSEFIKKNNVIFTDLIIVLSSSIIFEREFKTGQESATQEYMDNVPFETISIIRIPTQLGTKVLVANATFYTLLADVFLQFGVKVDFVVPELALGGPVGTFSVSTARYILTRNEALAPYKFVIDSSTVTTLQPTETKQEKVAKKNASLLYLLPVFGILILILLFVLFQPVLFKAKVKPEYLPPLAVPTSLPVQASASAAVNGTSVGTTSISPITQLHKPSSAQILYDLSSTAKVQQIKALLQPIGISNVESSSSSGAISQPIVVFSNTIDSESKQSIVSELKKLFPDITVQDNPLISVDVTISIGKSL